MAGPKRKPEPEQERPRYGPHPDDVAAGLFDGDDEPMAEGEDVIRWLEGEGDNPWRERSS